ncbi:MAG: amino acid adenylation domain-containing protein [Bacteroidota bacterium]
MDELCQTLGLPFNEGLLTPYAHTETKMMDGIYKDSRSMGDTNLLRQRSINASKADEWKQVFKDNFLSDESWDWMEYFGYVGDVKNGNGKLGDSSFFTPPPITQVVNNQSTSTFITAPSRAAHTQPPIAIVGMACRLPGANTLDEFWENLVQGIDVSEGIAPEDIEQSGISIEQFKQDNWVRRRLMLSEADSFDAAFFGYSPQEAKLMDPQHRVFLEVAYQALENAGYDPYTYTGRIGIFGGVARNAYFTNNVATDPRRLVTAGDYIDMLGYEKNFSVTRVAYKLNLRGPAVNVQTACSSTGVGVHLACQSIWQGDSDMVLVGGGRIQPDLKAGYEYTEGGPLSPDGYIRAFDAGARGMVKGNGMVFLVLKPLEHAIRDGDHVWATIQSTAINNDGANKIGFTAPSVQGQAVAIRQAHQKAGITADQVDYVEAHGTGTLLGDPIEVQGLTEAFRQTTDKRQFCAIGSVKTNIGHLDAGACVAGMMKVALAMKYETLPASLNFERPNPQIDFERSPFYVSASTRAWIRNGKPRRAGVSSFGLGGTNAHIIMQDAPLSAPLPPQRTDDAQLYLLSAKTQTALQEMEEQLVAYIENNPKQIHNHIAYTLATGRAQWQQRSALIIKGVDVSRISSNPAISHPSHKLPPSSITTDEARPELVFLFSGGGAQYVNMARDLYTEHYAFRQIVDRGFDYVEQHEQLFLRPLVFPERENTTELQHELERPSRALPALFIIEYALAQLWQSWGVRPTAVVGHSMGEYTAACIAGVMTWKEALSLVSLRGRLFEKLPDTGAMLSVALSETAIQPYLTSSLSVAVINKFDTSVVAGTLGGIEILEQRLGQLGIECKRIRIAVAAHSPQIDPILPEFQAHLEQLNFQPPTLPIISNATGDWADSSEIVTANYWLRHIRQTVRFADGLTTILASDSATLLEVGPGQTLATFARQHRDKTAQHQVLASVRHRREQQQDVVFIYKTLAKLWTQSYPIDWSGFFAHQDTRRIPLPTYPFERKRFWIPPTKTRPISNSITPMAQNIPPTVINSAIAVAKPQPVESAAIPQPTSPVTSPTPVSPQQQLVEDIQQMLQDMSGYTPEDLAPAATFLELGFDSLFLSQVVIQFNKRYDLTLSFRQLFEEANTIRNLADYAFANGIQLAAPPTPIEPIPPTTVEHTPTQRTVTTTPPATIVSTDERMPVPQSWEALFSQQIALLQQQLALLQNASGQPPSSTPDPRIVPSPPLSASPTTTSAPSDKTIRLRPTAKKGVTSKLKGYGTRSTTDELNEQQRAAIEAFTARYVVKTAQSKALARQHRQYYADPRTLSGFNKNWKEIVYQIASERSKGSRFWDIDGNEYIDFVMSYGVALFGHSPDFIMDAVRAQITNGTGLDTLTPLATEVAQIICRLSGMDRMTLANTGTEAVVGAIRAARAATGRDKIIIFDTDYHGLTDEFMLRGITVRGNTKAVPLAPGIPKAVQQSVVILDWDDPNIITKIRNHADDLAAVLVEPVQAQNPHWQHHDILRAIRQVTEELDVALVFDEVINGFRLLQGGAQEWFGIKADLVAYGKTVSGGLPCAAFAGKHRYMDVFDGGIWQFGDDSAPEAMPTYFAGTFIKNPVSVAASLAAMREIERRGTSLQLELNARMAQFATQLSELFLRLKAPLFIQSTSSIFIIKFVDKYPTNPLFYDILRFHGVNMRARPCFLSTAHTDEDLAQTLQLVERTLRDMLEEQLLQPYTGENLNEIYIPKTVEVATADATTTTLKRSSSSSLNVAPTDESPISTTARQIPLTAGQQEIFLNHQLSSEAARAYNIGTELRLSGQLNVAAFQTAIQLLVERHEALRTAIDASGKTQTVFEARSCTIQLEDLSQEQSNTQQLVLADYRIATMEQAFDLQQDELSRWCLFKLDIDEYVLFLTVHHIICDGWSLGILTRELGELYARECGLAHQNLTLPKSLTDYATERIAFGQTADFQKNQAYWLAQFKDGVPTSTVPADAARPPLKTYRGSTQKTRFTAAETTQLKQLAAQQGTTLYVYFLTAFATFLHKWSDESDWVIGIAAAGHNQPGNGSVVGHLIDLLPLRLQIDANDTFEQHIRQTRTRVLDAFDHQPYTFGTLVQQLNMRRDASRNALVSVAFNMDAPLQDLNYGNVQMQPQGVPHRYETFDVFINLKPIGDVIDLEWNFNTDLFQSELVARRLEVFRTWMANLGTSPNLPISQLSDMPSAQLETLRCWSTGPTRRYPVTESMHGLMTRQAAWTPAKVACISEGMVLTFEQLDKDSTLLASYLLEQGLTTHSFVGLSINRSAQMLVAMFAILKTGCAYVPIDPRNPIDRIALLLEDADCQALITTSDLGLGELAILPSLSLGVFEIDRIAWRRGGGHPLPQTRATDNAYVIYTSGSTGKPKGVVVRHESAINTLFAINEHLQMGVQDKIYSVSSMAFDMSIPDYFLPTAVGATLILASEAAKKDGFLLKEEMERYRPTVMQATPTTWKMLLLSGWEGDSALTVVAGGEGLSKDTARALVSSCKAVYNGYGPTEATIYTTYKLVTAAHLDQEAIGEFAAIGQPLANVTTHVLDEQMHPTPIGKSGELYIGGIGLSKGYLKQATRTAKSFVDSPYGKLYRTGDLVRYLPNGDLDFLGRIDHQVKIRGYRIELGEIEVALQQHPAVQQAATKVIRQTENHPQLVAYVVGERLRNYGGISPMSEEFRTFLRTSLPGYMIPAFFIELDRFPLTTSLKIDRKQLPAPVFATQQRQVLQPQTKHEQMLVQLFAELLGLTTVGVHDNFFELGGHSLVAVELMSRIRQQTGYQLPLTTLFQHATVRQLAMVLEEQEKQQSATKVVSKQAFSSLIPIRTTGSKPPIYLVHGGGLHVLFYQTLVQHLGEDQPVYALQARGLSGNETPLERIEDMAAHYLKEIAQVHPTDAPYHLAGYSLGGLIAWEMAKQLREQQQEVGILALFDAVAKAATVNGVNDKWAKKWNKATYNLKLFAKQPARAFRYKKHVLNMRYQHIKGKLNIAYRNNKTGEIEESHLPYGKEVYEKSLRAFELYELAPVDVKVQLFKAAEQMFYLKDPEFLGWKAYALRGIVTHDIPGDHLTLFDAPNDAIIGNILRQLTDVEV